MIGYVGVVNIMEPTKEHVIAKEPNRGTRLSGENSRLKLYTLIVGVLTHSKIFILSLTNMVRFGDN